MYLLRTTFLLLISLAALFALPTLASAASYYVAPNGGGSTCSSASPCSLNEGLSKAGGGDEVVLKEGIYYSTVFTKRSGVTIRAEIDLKPIVRPPRGWNPGVGGTSNFGDGYYVRILHDNTTVRGIDFDGNNRSVHHAVEFRGSKIIFEKNRISDTVRALVQCGKVDNFIFRFNLLEDAGGASMYCGTANASSPTSVNLEIYGNVYRRTASNGGDANTIDFKDSVHNADVHHNIFENQTKGGDGCIPLAGSNINFHDNIIRNTPCGSAVFDYVTPFNGAQVHGNAIYNVTTGVRPPGFIWYRSNRGNKSESRFYDNTLCKLSNYGICSRHGTCGSAPSGITFTNNRLNQPQSACDAEVARITNELKSLPGAGSGFPAGGIGTFTPGPCSLYPSGSANFSPYGLHWDWSTAQKALMLQATCETDSTTLNIGNGRETGSGATVVGLTYVYHQGYWNTGSGNWTPYSLNCSGNDKTKVANAWCKGSATASVPQSARWFVAYTCIWTGSKWQCGCSDSTCATSFWQVQGINR